MCGAGLAQWQRTRLKILGLRDRVPPESTFVFFQKTRFPSSGKGGSHTASENSRASGCPHGRIDVTSRGDGSASRTVFVFVSFKQLEYNQRIPKNV